ncbi:hypothetical protein IFM89_021994 [Coptis chinensis]|uniref:Polymerase/histidinol phosphatase N-terminal domain-containing protein n=1 Tax=Coptis chinensis TaxID=261450 RepID=A0A835I4G0_9MAGN|nr:hypothetical protein IFM89_021994 [Coptis chinensis]
MGDGSNLQKGKKKKKTSGSNSKKKKKMTMEQSYATKYVSEWVFLDSSSSSSSSSASVVVDDFGVQLKSSNKVSDKFVFELHSHSICSDGFLSPTAVVERAHRNGVSPFSSSFYVWIGCVVALQCIPEALEAARKFGIKIIPGVEISTIFTSRESGAEEPVHVLAYYGSCGPKGMDELETCLAYIREGRYQRAKNMISKLENLKMPLKWEHVAKIAGIGVAPGRLHVARAMVEAGHVENLKQAFNRYLYDGGPAYSTGNELHAEEAVQMICRTGGVAALAHPWALKNPLAVVRRLKDAGLHGIEVYRSDGKLAAFSDLADTYDLVKLGGSDYHGRGTHDESDLGSVNLPVMTLHAFLKVARPIWCNAFKDILHNFVEDPSDSSLEKLTKFGKVRNLKAGINMNCCNDVIDMCLSSWLTNDERQEVEFEALRLKLSHTDIKQSGIQISVVS